MTVDDFDEFEWWIKHDTTVTPGRGLIGKGSMVWASGDYAYAKRIFNILTATPPQVALGALADIATSDDLTLEMVRAKALRVYRQLQPDEG